MSATTMPKLNYSKTQVYAPFLATNRLECDVEELRARVDASSSSSSATLALSPLLVSYAMYGGVSEGVPFPTSWLENDVTIKLAAHRGVTLQIGRGAGPSLTLTAALDGVTVSAFNNYTEVPRALVFLALLFHPNMSNQHGSDLGALMQQLLHPYAPLELGFAVLDDEASFRWTGPGTQGMPPTRDPIGRPVELPDAFLTGDTRPISDKDVEGDGDEEEGSGATPMDEDEFGLTRELHAYDRKRRATVRQMISDGWTGGMGVFFYRPVSDFAAMYKTTLDEDVAHWTRWWTESLNAVNFIIQAAHPIQQEEQQQSRPILFDSSASRQPAGFATFVTVHPEHHLATLSDQLSAFIGLRCTYEPEINPRCELPFNNVMALLPSISLTRNGFVQVQPAFPRVARLVESLLRLAEMAVCPHISALTIPTAK